ncbi:MAG: tRNA pseudouridine(38-40) synthase TruA [Gammaproteobacteria bacterium]|nr:tRNA pseudouridine(38-40) synthase TruA [Gammaproteobacteria bacterium]
MTTSKHYIALGIEYSGTKFHGSQYQPQQRTVQSVLVDAVSAVAADRIEIEFAGRTDSGVHATSQIASFETNANRDSTAWLRGTNANLPNDIRLHSVQKVEENFDPRRTARWRRYMYILGMSRIVPAIGGEFAFWTPFDLDAELMNASAQCLLGEQDFSSFRAAQCQSISPSRCVHWVSVHQFSDLIVLDIVANAFLLRMVRNIMSSLIAVSRGDISDVSVLLKARDRVLCPPTAPPNGLYLVQIAYSQYPELSKLHPPRLLGPTSALPIFDAKDFPDVRPKLKP